MDTNEYIAEVNRLNTELRKVRHALELTDDTQKLTAEQLREARAEVERLRAALEPGTASAIVDGVHREAVRLGYSPYSSKPALTWLVEEVERLRAALELYADRGRWSGIPGDAYSNCVFECGEHGYEIAARALQP